MIQDIQDDRLSTDERLFCIDGTKTFISHCFLDKRNDINPNDALHGPYQVIYNEFLRLYNGDKELLMKKGELKNGLARKDVVSYAREIGQSQSDDVVDALQAVHNHVRAPLYSL
jgi:hypothetical protein